MRIIKSLSIIGLAAYLVLQGLFGLAEQRSPGLALAIGAIAIATGVLMFISLSHWIEKK